MTPERITAPTVMAKLESHLQRHDDKLDSKLHRHDVILFGEKGDGGLCSDVEEIKRGYLTMKGIGYAILLALLTNIVLLYLR